jgi:hypothetical protein
VQDEIVFVDRHLPPDPVSTSPRNPVYLDGRSVNNPNSRGRNIRYRIAASPGWTAHFTIL